MLNVAALYQDIFFLVAHVCGLAMVCQDTTAPGLMPLDEADALADEAPSVSVHPSFGLRAGAGAGYKGAMVSAFVHRVEEPQGP